MVLSLFKSASLRALVLALFLMPSYAFADYNQYRAQSGSISGTGLTLEAACDAYDIKATGHIVIGYGADFCDVDFATNSTGGSIGHIPVTIVSTSGSCPSGYSSNASNFCEVIPTCEAGNVKYLTGQPNSFPASPISSGGCSYSYLYDPESPSRCVVNLSGETSCTFTYSGNGEASTTNDAGELPDVAPEVEGTTDNTKSTSETNVSDPTVITDPDGTVTTTENIQIINTAGSGTTISDTESNIIIKSGSGTISNQDKTITTVSSPDGASTVVTSTDKTTSTPTVETTTINKTTGSTTTINNAGSTTTNNVTTVNNYNSAGKLTGSTTTNSDGSADAQGTDENGDKVYSLPSGQGSFDGATTAINSEIEQAKADLLTAFEGIKSEASELVSFSASSSGSLPCPPPVSLEPFGTFELCLTPYEDDLSGVGLILVFVATFLGLAIILR